MIAGHRRWLLALSFLTLAVSIALSRPVQAQQRQSHELWTSQLTPEQIKAALATLSQGDGRNNLFEEQFLKLLQERLKQDNQPHRPEDLEKALKLLKDNPQVLELAKKLAKMRQVDPGRPGKLTPDDIAKMITIGPDGIQPNPGLVPPVGMGPPGVIPPGTNLGDPPFGKADPPPTGGIPPGVGANPLLPPSLDTQQPIGPDPPRTLPSVDENPFPDPEATDARTKSLRAFTAIWERNIGPLDETPEVKRALFDLVAGNGLDLDLKDRDGNSIWDLLAKGDGKGFDELLQGGEGSNWKWPQLEFPKLSNLLGRLGWGSSSGESNSGNRSGSSSRWGSGRGGGGGIGFGGLNFAGSWTPVFLLGLVIVGILLGFWLKNARFRSLDSERFGLSGLGPWPLDPRQISTREDVVKAFEYLSVLICGPSARTWTHTTIADALSELAVTQAETARLLARLYELARYAPPNEPLPRDALAEARQLVCRLAGVPC